MMSQPKTNETFIALTPNGISFLQTEDPKLTNKRQDSLKKHLKAEVKVLGVSPIQNMLEWDGGVRTGRNCVYLGNRDPL